MKYVYLLVLTAILPSIGCVTTPKTEVPSAARGKDVEVATDMMVAQDELPPLSPDDVSDDNYRQILDNDLPQRLLQQRDTAGLSKDRPAYADAK